MQTPSLNSSSSSSSEIESNALDARTLSSRANTSHDHSRVFLYPALLVFLTDEGNRNRPGYWLWNRTGNGSRGVTHGPMTHMNCDSCPTVCDQWLIIVIIAYSTQTMKSKIMHIIYVLRKQLIRVNYGMSRKIKRRVLMSHCV